MPRPDRHFDWLRLLSRAEPSSAVDPRLRLRIMLACFAVAASVVMGRIVQLEIAAGAAYRAEAAVPTTVERIVRGTRGRIVARDGTVLAYDRAVKALAVSYRYLEEPPNAAWLRAEARARLSATERRNADLVAAAEAALLAERAGVPQKLADLAGLSAAEWRQRTARIQSRVEGIARRVDRDRRARFDDRQSPQSASNADDPPAESTVSFIVRTVADALFSPDEELPPPPVTLAEELAEHVVAEDLSDATVREIEDHPTRYPGAHVVTLSRRCYPAGATAAHLLGHLGAVPVGQPFQAGARRNQPAKADPRDAKESPTSADEPVGLMGVERQYEDLLRSTSGLNVETTDRAGRVISVAETRKAASGEDLVLTLDLPLQQTAEKLLAQAIDNRLPATFKKDAPPAGGVVVVMDIETGAVLAAASAPSFDPNVFSGGASSAPQAVLDDPRQPLFNRVSSMALPPGSVFKTVTAVALLESDGFDPRETMVCQGYLEHPDSLRCYIFSRYGVGHGPMSLLDALAQSCNVYFFYHAARLGPQPIVDWAGRFGFGRPTGIDLPGEAAGGVPSPDGAGRPGQPAWRAADTQALAIGQSSLTVTPLQVVRLMAAVANGGRLVTPHLALHPALGGDSPQPIAGLHAQTLALVREGLRLVVAHPDGTAHQTVYLDTLPIAGKTGTAETGGGQEDHAWFAGYAPADHPKVAFVVVLEHAGGASAAGPVAKRLVIKMQQLGYFGTPADPQIAFPAGKG